MLSESLKLGQVYANLLCHPPPVAVSDAPPPMQMTADALDAYYAKHDPEAFRKACIDAELKEPNARDAYERCLCRSKVLTHLEKLRKERDELA